MEKFKLNEKTAVVCGGLGLIGKEVSIAMAQAGAKTIVLDINEEKGKILEKEDKGIKFIKFDVTDIANIDKNIAKLFKDVGKIDIWVNVSYPRTEDWGKNKLEDIKIESWQKNVDMQLNSYCLSTRAIAELMKNNNIKGSIINFGSTYGVVAPDLEIYPPENTAHYSSIAPYSAIKGGIVNFSRYAASYYGKYGIRVNCLCPGGIFDNQNPIFVKNYEKKTALKRMGKPDDMASAALFLASDASSYITGAIFMVDGGWTCM